MASIRIITLGCSKNTVDSEFLAGKLISAGHEILAEEDVRHPKVLIINTCGFITSAKEESISVILQADNLRKKGNIEHLIVMGCLIKRYEEDLKKEFKHVDAWYGVAQEEELINYLSHLEQLTAKSPVMRCISTPAHLAYLKIAEGCNRTCSYCAIPMIRGKYVSKPVEALVDEAKFLAEKGVKELILIAQDLSFYGVDLYKEKSLTRLLKELVKIDGIEWIRLHYLYPHNFPYDVLDLMREEKKICKYIDIPLQHISDRILKSMNRQATKQEILDLIKVFREKLPDAALRTTFIVGYPGETDEEFQELMDFIKDIKFDRAGAFIYSEEDGTAAAELEDNISDEVKKERLDALMLLQQEISLEKNQEKIGETVKVLIDKFEDCTVGRTEFDSPGVDNEVRIEDEDEVLEVGNFYNIRIDDATEYDLFGTISE
jgi:ribosomal protein S12 methylthiotransferase